MADGTDILLVVLLKLDVFMHRDRREITTDPEEFEVVERCYLARALLRKRGKS